MWAVGCILYELIARRRAFASDWAVGQYGTSGTVYHVNIGLEIIPDPQKHKFISNTIQKLLDCSPKRRPRAADVYQQFDTWAANEDDPSSLPRASLSIPAAASNWSGTTLESLGVYYDRHAIASFVFGSSVPSRLKSSNYIPNTTFQY